MLYLATYLWPYAIAALAAGTVIGWFTARTGLPRVDE
jgi:hypothetical protein